MDIRGVNLSGVNILDKYRVPNAPIIGVATSTGQTTATVSFTQPSYDGNQPITSYTAVSTPGNLTGTINQSGSGTISISGLAKGTSYSFVVYATNSIGNSNNSSSSNSITTDAGDPYFNNVSLLLMGEGANNGTVFTDSSNNNYAITRTGTAIVTSTAQYKIGSSSIYQPNINTSYLTTASNNSFILGSGNSTTPWTIEWWMYPVMPQPSSGTYTRFGLMGTSTTSYPVGTWDMHMYRYSVSSGLAPTYDYGFGFYRANGTGASLVSGTTQYGNMWANQVWNHIAITFNGTALGGGSIWLMVIYSIRLTVLRFPGQLGL